MITVRITYPSGHVSTCQLYASQAQGAINEWRASGATVVIVENLTSYIIE